jgi:excisionase family DNA binding protein
MAEPEINPHWMPEPALYSKKQSSAFLGVSVRTINNLIRAKQLVRRKIGRKTLIPKTSLQAFLTKDHPTRENKTRENKN